MRPRRRNRVRRSGRRFSIGKLTFGLPRRSRRSRRLQMYEATAGYQSIPGQRSAGQQAGAWLKRRWLPVTGVIAVLLLVYLIFGTTWFYIYDIEVTGNRLLAEEEVYRLSQLEALNFFWFNPRKVAERLEEEPTIARTVVNGRPPNHVRVHIEERVPVAVWQSDGQSYYVNKEGVLFDLRGDASDMLVIRDLRELPVTPGSKVDPIAVRTARKLSELIPERKAFDWEPGVGISFLTKGEWHVTFGDHTQLPMKVAAFRAFQEQIAIGGQEEQIVLLDLSVPEHPYYRTGQ